jgi:acyl-lipid Delta6-acetylenase / acyl-lipid (9-3)-desaturase
MLLSFRRLRAQMQRQGLFKSSKSFYAWKILSLLGMYFTVATILYHGGNTWLSCLAAACLLATCWQQAGWLAHDFLHHQVFKNRMLNNIVGYFLGDVLQGFSVDWWKNKHNKHHAVPNECSETAEAVDPGARRSFMTRLAALLNKHCLEATCNMQHAWQGCCARGPSQP